MSNRSRRWLIVASLLIALATALGALGAHALKPRLDAHAMENYLLAVQYHFWHALGLLGIATVMRDGDNGPLRWSARLVLLGLALFAGSLYLIVFGAPRALGMVTPFGGASLMAGWVLFAVGVASARR